MLSRHEAKGSEKMAMKKYKPSNGDLRNLLRILRIDDYKSKRTELRAAALIVLKRTLSASKVEELLDNSSVIPPKTKRSHAGLRDVLSMRAMIDVCGTGGVGVEKMMTALLLPEDCGVKSSRSHSGYEVGTHVEMETEEQWLDFLVSKYGGEIEDVEEAGGVEVTPREFSGEQQEAHNALMHMLRSYSQSGLAAIMTAACQKHHRLGGEDLTPRDAFDDMLSFASKEVRGFWSEGRLNDLTEVLATKGTAVLATATLGYLNKKLRGQTLEEVAATEAKARSVATAKVVVQLKAMEELTGPVMTEEAKGSESMTTKTYEIKDEDKRQLVDLSLKSAGLPGISDLLAEAAKGAALEAVKVELEAQVSKLKSEAAMVVAAPAKIERTGSGEVPSGEIVVKNAADIFGVKGAKRFAFEFNIPTFEWEGEHPHVEVVDEDYVVREDLLLPVLLSLLNNEPTWLWGHTGTGKTTGLLQILARLKWPNYRVNLDGEMTRMDMMGKDVIRQEAGASVSEFQEGVFPRYLKEPYVLILDEFDAIRETVSYAVQRVLENDGLILTEDGGRVVQPHPMSRIFATANTVGQGDEDGLYPAVRPQSSATLDRFVRFVKVDYLEPEQRLKLIKLAGRGLEDPEVEMIGKYVTEHIQAFAESNSIMLPISPRGFCAMAKVAGQMAVLSKTEKQRKQAIRLAAEYTILNRATPQDLAVLNGIVDRVFG